MRLASIAAVVVPLLLITCPSFAKTQPIAGAVAFPTNAKLVLPFPAGHKIEILSGYGPGGGSSLHAGTNETSKANDYYALDFVYDDEPNYGKGKPVLAPLAGKVVKAGWADAGWANYGLRVILKHDLGDGHVYHSIYNHLDSLDPAVKIGTDVTVGQPLGNLGQSCMGQLSCSSFSTPHLHWAIHRDSTIGGSGDGGSYGGNAVVPEQIDGAEDIVKGMVVVSSNAGEPVCGDGYCTGDETHESCPADCPICAEIPPAGRVVDDSEPLCFTTGGTPKYWHEETAGYGGSLRWTMTTDDAEPDNHGIWALRFAVGGPYLLEAYTAAGFAQSKQASYELSHAGKTESVVIDQSAVDGWQSLGTFEFAPGAEQHLRLNDNTGEALTLDRKLAFDAIRLTGEATGGGGPGGQGGEGGAATAGAGGATAGAGGTGASAGEGPGGGGGSGLPSGGLTGDGCGCRLAGEQPLVAHRWAWLLALGAIAAARRGRRR